MKKKINLKPKVSQATKEPIYVDNNGNVIGKELSEDAFMKKLIDAIRGLQNEDY